METGLPALFEFFSRIPDDLDESEQRHFLKISGRLTDSLPHGGCAVNERRIVKCSRHEQIPEMLGQSIHEFMQVIPCANDAIDNANHVGAAPGGRGVADLEVQLGVDDTERLFDEIPAALRIDRLHEDGLPAYTTSAGWLGYSEVQIAESVDRALGEGFEHFKIKVGGGINEDARRALLVRGLIGSERSLMMDANQVWGVSEAVDQMAVLEEFDPAWIEEPTSPDDILGHRAIARAVDPIAVATGEHVHNQVMFKQFLQAGALGVCQGDPCRVAGLNEALAVLLMAAKSDVPVCPHAGGAGLGECVQHLSVFDHVAVGGVREDRVVEYVDHLHEHFLDPVRVSGGRYMLPDAPGFNTELRPEALARFRFPDGTEWL